MIPYIITKDTISLVIDNKPVIIDQYHQHFSDIKESIKNTDWENVKKMAMVTIVDTINENGLYVDTDKGIVKYKDYQLPNVLINKILEMVKHEFDLKHLLCFIDNLMLNPSYKTIQELYSFLEVGNLPITEDGCFLAYKKVNPDYTSIHDGKTMNTVGTYVKMERSLVDDNSDNTCSYGLHFCSYDYLKYFGSSDSKVLILKVNPRDCVSIPKDYNDTKGRACEYFILSELENVKMDKPFVDTSDYYDEFDDSDDEDYEDNIEYGLKEYVEVIDNFLDSIPTESNIEKYNLGYKHGRIKSANGMDDEYYLLGYKDGKNHKPKRKFD